MKNIKASFSKNKVIILRKLCQLVLGKLSGNVPATVINSIEENYYDPTIREHVEEIIPIAEPTIEQYAFPGNFSTFFRRHKAFEKKNLYLLKNVFVSPFSGLVWIGNKYLLAESLGSLYRIIGWNNILHEPLLEKKQLNEEDYVISCPNHPYYHWLFETLPGILIALETMPSVKIMISDNCPSYCTDMLKLLFGEEKYAKRVIIANGVKRIPKLFTLQQEPDAGFVHPIAIQCLKQLKSRLSLNTATYTASPNIYISRRKSAKRMLANEDEVEVVMQELGFSVIYCEELTLSEQISIFSNAINIVAPHGGGLSNIVWAEQKVNILEIFSYGYFNDCFARLAVSLGFDYSYTYADEFKGSGGKINVQEIKKLTRLMLMKTFREVPACTGSFASNSVPIE